MSTARSQDLGAAWTQPHRVSTGDEPLPSPMWPQVVFSEGRLTLLWAGGVTGETNESWLWLSHSDDGGKTWSDPTEIYNGQTQPFFHVQAKGAQLYLTWHGGEGNKENRIYWNASDDGGKTWRQPWTDPVRLDSGKSGQAMHPRLAVAHKGDNVAVTWQEGNSRVALSVSRDQGKTWPIADATIVTEEPEDQLRNPQVAVAENAAYVVWEHWPDKKKHIKSFADVNKVLPKDDFIRRVDVLP